MKTLIPMAICYDFDGTLASGSMQEYGFIKKLQMEPQDFWAEANKMAKEQNADEILAYMKLMKDYSLKKGLPFTRKEIQAYGATVPLFPGVENWFERINAFAYAKGVALQHYIISSGLKEMIEGTKIGKYFTEIYASCFMYDEKGEAVWPAVALNYTSKTQFLFRVNKGCPDINDNVTINAPMKEEDKPVPFPHMIYIGDGDTDVPCMKLIKGWGGHSISVYQENSLSAAQKAVKLVADGRVDIATSANYEDGRAMDTFVKAVIDKVSSAAIVTHLKNKRVKKSVERWEEI